MSYENLLFDRLRQLLVVGTGVNNDWVEISSLVKKDAALCDLLARETPSSSMRNQGAAAKQLAFWLRSKQSDASTEFLLSVDNRRVRRRSVLERLALQLDFYFGDENWSQDVFLSLEAEKFGGTCVSLGTILGFKRIRTLIAEHRAAERRGGGGVTSGGSSGTVAEDAELLCRTVRTSCARVVVHFVASGERVLRRLALHERIYFAVRSLLSPAGLTVEPFLAELAAQRRGFVPIESVLRHPAVLAVSGNARCTSALFASVLRACSKTNASSLSNNNSNIDHSAATATATAAAEARLVVSDDGRSIRWMVAGAVAAEGQKTKTSVPSQQASVVAAASDTSSSMQEEDENGDEEDDVIVVDAGGEQRRRDNYAMAIDDNNTLDIKPTTSAVQQQQQQRIYREQQQGIEQSTLSTRSLSVPPILALLSSTCWINALADSQQASFIERSGSFTVLTWNILAQRLVHFHSYCPQRFLDWNYRKQLISNAISTLAPDIILFQELQGVRRGATARKDDCAGDLCAVLLSLGYRSAFARRTSPHPVDLGNCVMWRNETFESVEKPLLVSCAAALRTLCTTTAQLAHFCDDNNQFAIAVLLQHKATSRKLMVATTHIVCRFEAPETQLAQVSVILNALSMKLDRSTPLILGGDFNALPDGAVYQFIVDGVLSDSSSKDARSSSPSSSSTTNMMINTQSSLSQSMSDVARIVWRLPSDVELPALERNSAAQLHHQLSMRSAVKQALGCEPEYTTLKPPSSLGDGGFEGCLDYLFYGGLRALTTPSGAASNATATATISLSNNNTSCDSIVPQAVLVAPARELLGEPPGAPNASQPSDHFPLACRFAWRHVDDSVASLK